MPPRTLSPSLPLPLSAHAQFYLDAHKNKALRILSRHLQLLW